MIVVHPAFDPKTGTWFLEEPIRVEARSLAAMAEKISARYAISDYYPRGDFRAPAWPKERIATRAPARLSQAPGTFANGHKVEEDKHGDDSIALPADREAKVNAVLDAWAGMMEEGDIVSRYGLASMDELRTIVREARVAADPRASIRVRRMTYRVRGRRKYDHDEVLRRWNDGETQVEIAAAMGMKQRSSVAVILACYRRKRDPRALLAHERGIGSKS